MKRALVGIGVVLGATLLGFALFFPTEDLVRRAFDAVGGARLHIAFGSAHLRPWGLSVEDVTLRFADERQLAHLDWLRVRPSWGGLLRLSLRPWHVSARLCDGDVALTIDLETPNAAAVDAAWTGLAFDRCGFPPPFDTVPGRFSGTAILAAGAGGAQPTGSGHVALSAVALPIPDGRVLGLEHLNIEQLDTDWTFKPDRITLAALSVKTPETTAQGGGDIFTASQLGDSRLQLRLTAKPGPYAPETVRRMFDGLPPAPGEPDARLVIVTGTINAPQVVRHE